MGRRNGSSRKTKHGNPGYCYHLTKHHNNQIARDRARSRGHDARDEVAYIRHRTRFLSGLGQSARTIVQESRLPAALSLRTSHLSLEEFCAYADNLTERLFQLELQIVQGTRSDCWHQDPRLLMLERALELRDRAEYLRDNTLDFSLQYNGIDISVPGARCSFDLNSDGLNACSTFIFACEKDARRRRILADCRQ